METAVKEEFILHVENGIVRYPSIPLGKKCRAVAVLPCESFEFIHCLPIVGTPCLFSLYFPLNLAFLQQTAPDMQ